MKIELGKCYKCLHPNIKYIRIINYNNPLNVYTGKVEYRLNVDSQALKELHYDEDGQCGLHLFDITDEFDLNEISNSTFYILTPSPEQEMANKFKSYACTHKDEQGNYAWVNCGFGATVILACKKCGILKKDYMKEQMLDHLCDCD